MGSGNDAYRPYLRFSKGSASNDFIAKEEVPDNILDNQDQDGNMMDQSKVNFDLPLNHPIRDAEFFEDLKNSDEWEYATNNNEE